MSRTGSGGHNDVKWLADPCDISRRKGRNRLLSRIKERLEKGRRRMGEKDS